MPRRVKSGWLAEVRVGYGRGAPRRSKMMPTKAAAAAWEESQREAQRRGEYVDARDARTPFRVVADALLNAVEDTNTSANYEQRLRVHINPVLGDLPIGVIAEAHIEDLERAIRAKPLASSTRHGIVLLAMMVLRRAQRERLRRDVPRITLPELDRAELVIVTPAQARLIIESTAERGRAAVALGFGCGLRQGEALGLQGRYVDMLRATVNVQWQIDPQRVGHLKRPKTAESRGVVPAPRWALELVAEHMARWPVDDGPLFRNSHGRPWRRAAFNEGIWQPALVAAGLWPGCGYQLRGGRPCPKAAAANAEPLLCPKHARRLYPDDDIRADLWSDDARDGRYGFHIGRHFFASVLIDAGRHPEQVRRLMRHKHITETMETYGHLFPHAEGDARSAIEDVFRRDGNAPGTNGLTEPGP